MYERGEVVALTAKRKRFADEYLIDLNATQAAIRAGYSKKTAYSSGERLLKVVEVQVYIQKRMAEKDDELIAKQDEVLRYLTNVMRRAEFEGVVVTLKKHKSYYDDNNKKIIEDSEEAQIVEIPTKVSDSNKAAELLGKRHGLFTDRMKLEGDLEFDVRMDYGNENNT